MKWRKSIRRRRIAGGKGLVRGLLDGIVVIDLAFRAWLILVFFLLLLGRRRLLSLLILFVHGLYLPKREPQGMCQTGFV